MNPSFRQNCMADLVQNELLTLRWACLHACASPHRLSVLMLKAAESGPWKTHYPQPDFILKGQCQQDNLASISFTVKCTGHVCACICLFPLLLSYVPFSSLNNSCFKILRVDSGERGNINLRPTPCRAQWKSLVICHPPWSRAMSRGPPRSLTPSLSLPQLPPLQGHLARPQPHCSNGANAIKEDSCWCNLFWKSDERLWTDAMLQ